VQKAGVATYMRQKGGQGVSVHDTLQRTVHRNWQLQRKFTETARVSEQLFTLKSVELELGLGSYSLVEGEISGRGISRGKFSTHQLTFCTERGAPSPIINRLCIPILSVYKACNILLQFIILFLQIKQKQNCHTLLNYFRLYKQLLLAFQYVCLFIHQISAF